MRILVFTDPHGSIVTEGVPYYVSPQIYMPELAKRAQQADFVICGGDISVFGNEAFDTLEAMNSWGKPIYIIHGNHEDEELLVDVNEQFPNIHFVHGKEVEVQGINIVGWGGGGFSRTDPELKAFAKTLKPKPNRIFVIHGPPHGTKVDYMDQWEDFRGCKTRREVIEQLQPFLVVCGHIHENFGKQDKIGKSIVLNPGPLGKFIELEAKPAKKTAK